jgi:O-antigen/teichoic acid export membrane protein
VASLTRQALIVSVSRFVNQGLMVISPVILVRLLSVEDFGEYREFLMYSTLVANLGSFSLQNSLLYFIGLQPGAAWGYVRRISIAVGVSSTIAVVAFAVLDATLPKPLIDDGLWPCILYVLFYVNVDFWEFLWVAQKRPTAVLLYTGGRLLARIVVVITAASVSNDVETIVWSMVVLEGVRLVGSTYFWRRQAAREPSEPLRVSWREQMEFCVPSGIAVFVTTLNSSLGGMFVDQSLGEAELAQFVIGGYVIMIVYPLRNSISDVMLPEMAALSAKSSNGWLPLWQRSVVLFAILLWPAAFLLARYAEPFVTTLFSAKYRDAVTVFQMHCLLIALSCFDIALVLRAVNRTRALVMANVLCVLVNVVAMLVLVPAYQSGGAGAALVVSALVGLVYLVRVVAKMQDLSVRQMIPFRRLGQVAVAAVGAGVVTAPAFWQEHWGIAGVLASCLAYCGMFVLLLRAMRVAEADWILGTVTARLRPRGSAA